MHICIIFPFANRLSLINLFEKIYKSDKCYLGVKRSHEFTRESRMNLILALQRKQTRSRPIVDFKRA